MMITRSRVAVTLALAVAFGLLVDRARAVDPPKITWVMAPADNVVTFSGSFGQVLYNYDNNDTVDANGGPAYLERYSAVPQTDAGTSPFAGYTNSMQTKAGGTFQSVGADSFLTSLNFGPEPDNPYTSGSIPADHGYANFLANDAKLAFTNNGTWLPQTPSATDYSDPNAGPGVYGHASTAQAAFTLVGASGQNWNNTGTLSATPGGGPLDPGGGPNHLGTAGRVSLVDTAGTLNSDNKTISVSQGAFDAKDMQITGALGLMLNYTGDMGDSDSKVLGLPGPAVFAQLLHGLASASNDDPLHTGLITRSGSDYVLTMHYTSAITLPQPNGDYQSQNGTPDVDAIGPNIGTALYINAQFGGTFKATAQLAPGDVNFDNIVSLTDLTLVASHYGQSDQMTANPGMIPGDANGDGIVSLTDLTLIASNWQHVSPGGGGSGLNGLSVPEPGTWILLVFGAVGLWFGRRRV